MKLVNLSLMQQKHPMTGKVAILNFWTDELALPKSFDKITQAYTIQQKERWYIIFAFLKSAPHNLP